MSVRHRFGRFEVLPAVRQVLQDGEPAVLGARAFDLLLCLIEHRNRVVAKDELMQLVWPGVVVEDNNLSVQISALRKLLGAQALVTVPGRGYRFALEVSELMRPASSAADGELSLPDKPSIAVLPFSNLSDDQDQAYFTDGITEDLITELSRFHSLFVIARNSSFTYQSRSIDVRTVARELGVRYVLEGSIRRATNRIRVAAQLIDAQTGIHIWAEKFERVLADNFAVQEELTQAIVAAITPQIENFEAQRVCRVQADDLSACQLALRGWAAAWQALSETDRSARNAALEFARAALSLEPHCGAALRTIAFAQWQHLYFNTATSAMQARDEGLIAATRAITLDQGDHLAHLWKGQLALLSGQPQTGLQDVRRANELNPNDALTLSCLGLVEALCGDQPRGIECTSAALRLSPRDPVRCLFLNNLAWVYFCASDYANGANWAQRAIGEAAGFAAPRLCLVLNQVGLAEIAQAQSELELLRELAPELILSGLAGQWLSCDPAYRQRASTFLRIAAGLQEPSAADALR